MNKQGTIALWSNASCIRSGGWWIESWRCLNSFDGKTCEAKQREEGQKLDPVELIRLIMRMYSCRSYGNHEITTQKKREIFFSPTKI